MITSLLSLEKLTGKTIAAAALANYLSITRPKEKVLLIDLDYETCGLTNLILGSTKNGSFLLKALNEESNGINSSIINKDSNTYFTIPPIFNFFFIPASEIEIELPKNINRSTLMTVLSRFGLNNIDRIIIDTGSSVEMAKLGMSLADNVIIPMVARKGSVKPLLEILIQIAKQTNLPIFVLPTSPKNSKWTTELSENFSKELISWSDSLGIKPTFCKPIPNSEFLKTPTWINNPTRENLSYFVQDLGETVFNIEKQYLSPHPPQIGNVIVATTQFTKRNDFPLAEQSQGPNNNVKEIDKEEATTNLLFNREFKIVRLDQITESSPTQTRENPFDPQIDADDAELFNGIKSQGVLQPIMLVPLSNSINCENKYRIVHGYRRVTASRLLGLTEIPAFIANSKDDVNLITLMENIGRKNLTPYETALAFKTYRNLNQKIIPYKEIAAISGKSLGNIYHLLGIMDQASEPLLELFKNGMASGTVEYLIPLFAQVENYNYAKLMDLVKDMTRENAKIISKWVKAGMEPFEAIEKRTVELKKPANKKPSKKVIKNIKSNYPGFSVIKEGETKVSEIPIAYLNYFNQLRCTSQLPKEVGDLDSIIDDFFATEQFNIKDLRQLKDRAVLDNALLERFVLSILLLPQEPNPAKAYKKAKELLFSAKTEPVVRPLIKLSFHSVKVINYLEETGENELAKILTKLFFPKYSGNAGTTKLDNELPDDLEL